MNFTTVDIINLFALLIGMAGSFIMFYYSPVIDFTIQQSLGDGLKLKEKAEHKNKMVRRGMFLLFISFILQFTAIFLSVATKS
jgi:hypothetical protein